MLKTPARNERDALVLVEPVRPSQQDPVLRAATRVHASILGGLAASYTREDALRARIAHLELCLGDARSPDVQALLLQLVTEARADLDRVANSGDQAPTTPWRGDPSPPLISAASCRLSS